MCGSPGFSIPRRRILDARNVSATLVGSSGCGINSVTTKVFVVQEEIFSDDEGLCGAGRNIQ